MVPHDGYALCWVLNTKPPLSSSVEYIVVCVRLGQLSKPALQVDYLST